MRLITSFSVLTVLLFLYPVSSGATVLYTDSTEVNGVLQSSNANIIGEISSGDPSVAAGVAFTLPAGQSYTGIGFDVEADGGTTATFSIFDTSYNFLASTTVTVPASYDLVTGFFGSGLVLTGGQTYILLGDASAGSVSLVGTTAGTLGTLYQHVQYPGQGYWQTIGPIPLPAFDIISTPEPGSVAQVLAGLGLLAYFSRRRKS